MERREAPINGPSVRIERAAVRISDRTAPISGSSVRIDD